MRRAFILPFLELVRDDVPEAADFFEEMEEMENQGKGGTIFDGLRERVRAGDELYKAQIIERYTKLGVEIGVEQQRTLLLRVAAARFGDDNAQRLGAILNTVGDPDRLGEIAELIGVCDDGEDLLERAAG